MKRTLPIFWLFFLLLWGVPFTILSQFQFTFNDSIPVVALGNTMEYPWAGGLNYAQFSVLDYDVDGDDDLIVFDRSNDQIRVFNHRILGANHSYYFDPLGDSYFPSDVRYRMYLADYDEDGKNDLFTYGIGGIKVYRNTGSIGTGLQWTLVKNLVYSDYNGTTMGLYVSSADIPAIVDVDGDQDLDVLTFSIAGDHVEYHKNMSREWYGHSDSLLFVLKNRCWGGFKEEVTSNAITLFDNSTLCTTGNVPNPEIPLVIKPEEEEKAHSGSTLLALDLDHSGVLDLLVGDVAYGNLNKLLNGGTNPNQNSAMVSVDPNFPSNSVTLNLQLFPGSFYVDVDFDGKKDLLCSPNAKGTSENEHSIWKYKNAGSSLNPTFIYETNSFLQRDMIEHGIGSVPVLADVTNDGLPDLFVANYFAYKPTLQKESRIAYYKNTGTLLNPVFTFIDSDFLNLSQLNLGFRIIPTFGDITGDGKPELLLGLEDGSLRYYENQSTGSSPVFGQGQAQYAGVDVGQFAAPQLFDLNNDGLLDLIVGEKTGKLLYFENSGTSSNPNFQLVNAQLGGIDIEVQTPDGFPQPHFFKHQDTTYLMMGGFDGKIRFYDSIQQPFNGVFHLRSFPFLGLSLGSFSSVFVEDIDHDNNLDLYVGQDLGGIFRLEHQAGASLATTEESMVCSVYPNPFQDELTLHCHEPLANIVLYALSGMIVFEGNFQESTATLYLPHVAKGVYLLKREGQIVGRFIKA
ncbi:MAG: T9SS type A sorting domain-containing protein [Flavobacteriales bacterium]